MISKEEVRNNKARLRSNLKVCVVNISSKPQLSHSPTNLENYKAE